MRRVLIIATMLCLTGAGLLTAVAGADDTHRYKVELDNAFGIVEGSLVKIAGVESGRVVSLDVNEDKRALLDVETSGPMGQLGEDTTCSSEPQSLIAEYFLDCQPAGDPLPEDGTIPVEQVTHTVQPDLVNNTLREPFKRRFQIIINEFGTALAGNPENLNAAIRRGAPALRELEEMLDVLADHNRIIRDLNANSDRVIGRMAERREDVVRFIQEARDTAAASASRRADLSRDFDLLDDFLAELQPTLADTGELARAQTPVLADLRAAAPGLNTLATNLPGFNTASKASLTTLGDAAVVGRRALTNGADEIQVLRRSFKNAPRAAELLADLLADAEDPRRAVEIDARVERDTGRSSPKPGTKNTMGYTALEGLLNYAYYQAGALNQYDQVSHLLHFSLYDVNSGPCANFSTGRDKDTGEPGVPAAGGGKTTDPEEIHRCVAWMGPNQPGLSEPLDLPRYDRSVCPGGTKPAAAAEELCHPDIPADATSFERASATGLGASMGGPGSTLVPPGAAAPGTTPGLPQGPGSEDIEKGLEDLLGLPGEAGLPDVGKGLGGGLGPNGRGKGGNGGGGSGDGGDELMDFLFGS